MVLHSAGPTQPARIAATPLCCFCSPCRSVAKPIAHYLPCSHPPRDEVKAAFRRAALVCHPDVDKSPQAAARFTQVKLAADVLLKGVGRLLLIAMRWEAAARATTGCTAFIWGMWQPLTCRPVHPKVAHKWRVCFPHVLPLLTTYSTRHSQGLAADGRRRQRRQQRPARRRPLLACRATARQRCGRGCWWPVALPLDTGGCESWMAWESNRNLLLGAPTRLPSPQPTWPRPACATTIGPVLLACAPRLNKKTLATCPRLPAPPSSPCRYSWQAYVARKAAYSTPEEAERRLRNPSPQRRKLLQVLVADEKQHAKQGQLAQRGAAAAPAAAEGGGSGGAG